MHKELRLHPSLYLLHIWLIRGHISVTHTVTHATHTFTDTQKRSHTLAGVILSDRHLTNQSKWGEGGR